MSDFEASANTIQFEIQ